MALGMEKIRSNPRSVPSSGARNTASPQPAPGPGRQPTPPQPTQYRSPQKQVVNPNAAAPPPRVQRAPMMNSVRSQPPQQIQGGPNAAGAPPSRTAARGEIRPDASAQPPVDASAGGGDIAASQQLAAEMPPEITRKTTITQPDGSTITTEGMPESLAEQDVPTLQQEQNADSLISRMAPSPVEGVSKGHYDKVIEQAGNDPAEKQKVEQKLKEFGSYPGSDDPDSPPPPVTAEGSSFNPYTGGFTGNQIDGFKMAGQDIQKQAQGILSDLGIDLSILQGQ